MADPARTPGPSLLEAAFQLPALVRDPLRLFLRWREKYGDAVLAPGRRPPLRLIFAPADVRHVLTARPGLYRKGIARFDLRNPLGEGLASSNGALHARQRSLMLPAFHRPKMSPVAAVAAEEMIKESASWPEGGTVDLWRAMARVSLAVTGRALLGDDLAGEKDLFIDTLLRCQRFVQAGTFTLLPRVLRTLGRGKHLADIDVLDGVAQSLVERRRAAGLGTEDLLSILLRARGEDGQPLDGQLIRDELKTMLAAGHDTLASALAWTWHLLAGHPGAMARTREEADRVLGDRLPAEEDLPSLSYTEMVFSEALRLYPPIWSLGRQALADDRLPSGTPVPAGTQVALVSYVIHRNPAAFPDPERFRPERFTPEARRAIPPGAYIPFGDGARACIGASLALAEAVSVISVMARRFDFAPLPDQEVGMEPLISLRPRNGIKMRVHRRKTT